MRQGAWLGWLLAASLSAGCGGVTGQARFPVEKIPVPDDSQIYMAEARPDGVTGGPGGDKVEAELQPSGYLVGDRFSVADLTAAALLFPLVRPPETPHLIPPPLPEPVERFREFREQPTPELERSARQAIRTSISVNERLAQLYHPWTSYVIVPLFALANAGTLKGEVERIELPRVDNRDARPKGSAVTSDGRYAVISAGPRVVPNSVASGTVRIIDLKTRKVIATVTGVGNDPYGLAVVDLKGHDRDDD